MNKLTRTAALLTVAAAAIVPISSAQATQARPAAATNWKTIETLAMANQQACKTSVEGGKAWRISNRLDTRKVTPVSGEIEATLTATFNNKPTARKWDSGYQKKGKISAVGTFNLLRKPGWRLVMTIHASDFGDGGKVDVAKLPTC